MLFTLLPVGSPSCLPSSAGATASAPCQLCCRSHWGSDPLVRGSYSYLSPDCTPADVAALTEPLWSPARAAGDAPGSSSPGGAPALLFAGEACHLKYIGTMHGAALTGQAAAERLIHQWQQPQAASA